MSFDSNLMMSINSTLHVSIPLEQGNVFRRFFDKYNRRLGSQSLWNRAMSFDILSDPEENTNSLSQSLWNRAMSFDLLGDFK